MISCQLITFIDNGDLKSTCDFNADKIMAGEVIYEVLRVVEGVPLFLNEHLIRFQHSASMSQLHIPDHEFIKKGIRLMIETNGLKNGNIRLQTTSAPDQPNRWYCWVAPHYYPTKSQYAEGVRTGLFQAKRNHPNIKRWNGKLKQEEAEKLATSGYYELLLTSDDKITEGSRSNVFFIKENELFTAKVNSVLPGVTRAIVIQIIRALRFQLHETDIDIRDLPKFQSAFLTGTSPGILPIQSIDDYLLRVDHPLLQMLQVSYQQACEKALKNFVW
jgi:branched-chain amino acid aminotransferase